MEKDIKKKEDKKEQSKPKFRLPKSYKGVVIQPFKMSGKSYKIDDPYQTMIKARFDALVEKQLIIK